MSQAPFDSIDYNDGEIKRLVPGSLIWQALVSETWLNCSDEIRRYFVDRLQASHRFSGIVVSRTRRQIELTYIPHGDLPNSSGPLELIAISLQDFHRFLHLA